MNKKTIMLRPGSHAPFETVMNEKEQETHALIRVVREQHCKLLNLVFINKDSKISKSLPAKPFTQLNLVNCEKFSIEASFVAVADSFVELEVYTGSREEMLMTEVEVSFSASPFYISCNNDQLEFTIGAPGQSRMEVKPEDGKGFSVLTIRVQSSEEITQQNYIASGEGAQVIGRLYGRIKGRVNGKDFHQRQEENAARYAENFNKTLNEGFFPVTQEAADGDVK